jgi:ubiquinone/menaquinone biosynthesis C-methylase UbiE
LNEQLTNDGINETGLVFHSLFGYFCFFRIRFFAWLLDSIDIETALESSQNRVGKHYDSIFDYEFARLSEHCPVEFAITARCLQRWIPNRSTVAEIGVGVGRYSELLAQRDCSVYLIDVSQSLLDATITRLQDANLAERIGGTKLASASNLDFLGDDSLDAVLMLGPLYHLCEIEERRQAVNEAARILKPQGLLFVAGINRLGYLRDLFYENPEKVLAKREFHRQYLQDGNLSPEQAPPIGFAHLTTVQEFRELFAEKFSEKALLGVESFTNSRQHVLHELNEDEIAAWLGLVEQTASTPEGLGVSDHFLFVGQVLK